MIKKLQSFFLGILAAISALFLEILFLNLSDPFSPVDKNGITENFFSLDFFFFSAIAIEELLKFFLISGLLSKRKDIVFNSFLLGLGFSSVELAFVYWNHKTGIEFEVSSIIGMLLIHISTSVIIAYSVWKNARNKIPAFLGGFIPAFIIHSLYNISSTTETIYSNKISIAFMIFLPILAFSLIIKSKISKIRY